MNTDVFSQLTIRLIDLEEAIEETMYFSMASSLIAKTIELKELPLPGFLLGEVRRVVTSPLYFEYNQNRKQKVLMYFSKYANSYTLIKLTASWEEFMFGCHIVMDMAKTNDYSFRNEVRLREQIRNKKLRSKSGLGLLRNLEKLYQLEITQSKEYSIISSIYKLRDCIVHRDGVISKWDLDKNSNFMSTIWKKAIVRENKQDLSAWTLAGKRKFESMLTDEKKQWFENQVIALRDTEICDIGLSLIEVGNIILDKLVNHE